jgi:hypothetical protein
MKRPEFFVIYSPNRTLLALNAYISGDMKNELFARFIVLYCISYVERLSEVKVP